MQLNRRNLTLTTYDKQEQQIANCVESGWLHGWLQPLEGACSFVDQTTFNIAALHQSNESSTCQTCQLGSEQILAESDILHSIQKPEHKAHSFYEASPGW